MVLSAAGSRIAPSRERWLKRRAIIPSNMSVNAALTKRTNAARKSPRSDAKMKTGTAMRRRRVSAFGTVNMGRKAEGRRQKAEVGQPETSAFCLLPSYLRPKLVQRRLPKVDRLPLRQQQVLPHQVVDEARHRLARGADHVRDRLVRGALHGHVAVLQHLAVLPRQVEEEAGQAAVHVHRRQRLD